MKTPRYYDAMKTTKHDCLVVWFDELYNDTTYRDKILFIGSEPSQCYKHLYPKAHGLLDKGI